MALRNQSETAGDSVVPLQPTRLEKGSAALVILQLSLLAALTLSPVMKRRTDGLDPFFCILTAVCLGLAYLQYLAIFQRHAARAATLGMLLIVIGSVMSLSVFGGLMESNTRHLWFRYGHFLAIGALLCWCGIQNLHWHCRAQLSRRGRSLRNPTWRFSIREGFAGLTILSLVFGIASLLSRTLYER